MHNDKQISIFKEKVKAIINKIDPWFLMEMEAPENEYEKHISSIVSFIVNNKPDYKNLYTKIKQIFVTDEFELDENKINQITTELLSIDFDSAFMEKV